jgi:restriction endonuclease Mrr
MTFTEAALEILRRAGKPLHFKEIAAEAITAGLLSHVGQTPEATMGARLLSMARREHDRRVTAIEPGIFALVEWGIPTVEHALDPSHVAEDRPEAGPTYRPKERHPPLQEEYAAGGRRSEGRRRGEEDGQRKKKYPPPAEAAHQWLRERGEPATLAELAQALRASDKIAEALERDLKSFERALQEENRRRSGTQRPPLFKFEEDGRVTGLEIPKEQPRERPPRPEKPAPQKREEAVRPASAEEQRRAAIRLVRRRIGSLDAAALERVVTAFLEATGYRELNMARRSAKEGPLYLARHRWGAGELRYAVRVVKPGRDLSRQDVQDLRRDISHYSAQLGILFGAGECSRDAKGEANTASSSPIMLYGGEGLAEAMVDAGLGVTKRLIEWVEYDDEFFVAVGAESASGPQPDFEAPPPAPAPSEAEGEREERRGRDRRRDRRGRDREPRPEGAPSAPEREATDGQLALGLEAAPAPEQREATPAPEDASEPAETTREIPAESIAPSIEQPPEVSENPAEIAEKPAAPVDSDRPDLNTAELSTSESRES